MRVGGCGSSSGGTGVAPPVFGIGKSNSAAGAAVHAGRQECAAGIAANHGLVAGGTALAAFVNRFVMRHGAGNVNAYKLTLRPQAVKPGFMGAAPVQTVQICCASG